jgi:hypothetical protein
MLKSLIAFGRLWVLLVPMATAACPSCGGDDSSESNAGAGGAGGGCTGVCTPGSTCTINPPPGSLAPSIVCQCTAAGSWCCDGDCAADGSGGSGGNGSTGGVGATGGSGAAGGTGGQCARIGQACAGASAARCCPGARCNDDGRGGVCVGDASDAGNDGPCTPSAVPGGVQCGTTTCGAGQICVFPCCGGLPIDGGCTPPPAYCANAGQIVCPTCDMNCRDGAGCFGRLEGRRLSCLCA